MRVMALALGYRTTTLAPSSNFTLNDKPWGCLAEEICRFGSVTFFSSLAFAFTFYWRKAVRLDLMRIESKPAFGSP
jgi:hypothetical protein